jgi:hypothetical protein
MKKILILGAALFLATTGQAKADFSLNIFTPPAHYHPVPRRVVYVSPPPVVYYQTPHVVYQNYDYGYYTQPNYVVYQQQYRHRGRGHDRHRGGYGHRYGR